MSFQLLIKNVNTVRCLRELSEGKNLILSVDLWVKMFIDTINKFLEVSLTIPRGQISSWKRVHNVIQIVPSVRKQQRFLPLVVGNVECNEQVL